MNQGSKYRSRPPGPVRLQMGRIDNQLFRLASALREFHEDASEHAQLAPADEAVVDCLVWPVAWRHIAPAQAVADDEDDAADHLGAGQVDDESWQCGAWETNFAVSTKMYSVRRERSPAIMEDQSRGASKLLRWLV